MRDFRFWHPTCCQELKRIMSAEALDILAYLKTAPGKFVSLPEISRRAGGRRRYEESPNWARNLMSPLLEAGVIEVNARGHYRVEASAQPQPPAKPAARAPLKLRAKIVGDDYFPTGDWPRIVGGDYFPTAD
jgi:hypothetical protein